METFFLKTHTHNVMEKLPIPFPIPDPFLSTYIETKLQTICFYLIQGFFKKQKDIWN